MSRAPSLSGVFFLLSHHSWLELVPRETVCTNGDLFDRASCASCFHKLSCANSARRAAPPDDEMLPFEREVVGRPKPCTFPSGCWTSLKGPWKCPCLVKWNPPPLLLPLSGKVEVQNVIVSGAAKDTLFSNRGTDCWEGRGGVGVALSERLPPAWAPPSSCQHCIFGFESLTLQTDKKFVLTQEIGVKKYQRPCKSSILESWVTQCWKELIDDNEMPNEGWWNFLKDGPHIPYLEYELVNLH